MSKSNTGNTSDVISEKIRKMVECEKNLATIKSDIRESGVIDILATFPLEIRPDILTFKHYSRHRGMDYILIPQTLTEYAFVITDSWHNHVGNLLKFKINSFEFTFPIQSVCSQNGLASPTDAELGSGMSPLSIIAERGVKIVFLNNPCDKGHIIRKDEKSEYCDIRSWRIRVLEDHGTKAVKKYIDPWLTVITQKEETKSVESTGNPDMDCHPDHIQSVIDRHEDFEYRQRMIGENDD